MKISEQTCGGFVELLASNEPAPGGGGAAALCGAIGTALSNMVGSLTLGKKKYADVEEEIKAMKSECDQLQMELLELIDGDAESFRPLAAAYGLPANTEEEKLHKSQVLEKCSKDACHVPLAIMQKCCRAIELAERFAAIGSKLAVSDAGCSAVILSGALKAASLNIYINTKGLQDEAFALEMNQKVDQMLEEYGSRAEMVFENVRERVR